MSWSMPRSVLQVVAAVLGVVFLGAFAIGIFTADSPARLPGERGSGEAGGAEEAVEATPLQLERIEGAPQPKELTPEEKAKLEEEAKAKAEAAAKAKAEADAAAAAAQQAGVPPAGPQTPTLQTPPDPIGQVLEKAPPPPEEPVF